MVPSITAMANPLNYGNRSTGNLLTAMFLAKTWNSVFIAAKPDRGRIRLREAR
jgi:hypothetical protein